MGAEDTVRKKDSTAKNKKTKQTTYFLLRTLFFPIKRPLSPFKTKLNYDSIRFVSDCVGHAWGILDMAENENNTLSTSPRGPIVNTE